MFLADVVGTVVSPVQIPVLDGRTLLILRPVTPDGSPTGKTRIGIDHIGAGVGDRVLVLDEGNGGVGANESGASSHHDALACLRALGHAAISVTFSPQFP